MNQLDTVRGNNSRAYKIKICSSSTLGSVLFASNDDEEDMDVGDEMKDTLQDEKDGSDDG